MARRRQYPWQSGFTLVELLVVIGIIALLVSMLLPVLSKARRAAQALQCMGNLRTMAQAMQIYAAENKGAIIGSGCTSGLTFYPQQFQTVVNNGTPPAYSNGNIPGYEPIYPTDYMTPMIVQMRLGSKSIKDPNEANRFFEYVNMPLFQCPSYVGVMIKPTNGTWSGIVQATSYVTAWAFLLNGPFQAAANIGGQTGVSRISSGGDWPQTPPAYAPRISKIGDASRKIFMADGAKGFNYKKGVSGAPAAGTYDLTIGVSSASWYDDNNGSFGCFTDLGPWSLMSGAYDRSANPLNGGTAATSDPRLLAYRHGGTKNGLLRMNAVFFDGHAESLTEIESANPALWLPKNTAMPSKSFESVYPDTTQKYGVVAFGVVP